MVHPSLSLLPWGSGSFHMEERWLSSTLCQLLRPQPNLPERLIPTSAHFQPPRCTKKSTNLHQNQPLACLPSCSGCTQRRMEDCLPDSLWFLRMVGNA